MNLCGYVYTESKLLCNDVHIVLVVGNIKNIFVLSTVRASGMEVIHI